MDFRAIINAHYANNTLDLPSSAFPAGKATQMMEKFLPNKRITISSITSKTDQSNGLTLIGKGVSLPFLSMDVTIVFEWLNDQIDFKITGATASGWNISQSFDQVENGLLPQLIFEPRSALYLTTHDIPGSVKEGMTFSGTLQTSSGGLQNYAFMASGNTGVVLTGNIDYDENGLQMTLGALLSSQIVLGFLTIQAVNIILHIESSFNTYSKSNVSDSYLEFKATIAFSSQQITHTLPISARLYTADSNIQFNADITGLVNSALDEIATLLNNINPKSLIRTDLHLEDVIKLSDLNFQINPSAANKLNAVRLQISTVKSWDLVKDSVGKPILALKEIQMGFGMNAPFGKDNLTLSIIGEVQVGKSGIIELNAYYPDYMFRGSLKFGTEIKLREVFGEIFGYSPSDIPDLNILDLDIEIQPSSSYSITIDIEGNWEIPVNGSSFAVKELKMAASYSNTQSLIAEFEGVIGFDNQNINLKASHPSANEGWIFKGGTAPGQVISMAHFIADLEYFLDMDFPDFIKKLTLKNLDVTYYTKTNDLAFVCETVLPTDNPDPNKWPVLTLEVSLTHINNQYIKHLAGRLSVAGLQFDIVLNTGGSTDTFWGDYKNAGGNDTFSVGDIIQLITADKNLYTVTKDMRFNIKDAFVGYYKDGLTNPSKWLLGIDMEFGADLTSLPLVGTFIPKEEALRLVFQPRIATQDFAENEMNTLKAIIPSEDIALPTSLNTGLALNIQLNMGRTVVPMSLPVDFQNGQVVDQTTTPVTTSSTTKSPADKATWFNLQKTFGPLQLQRVGVLYDSGQLTFLLDGSFSLAGLTLSLNGLSASSKLNPIDLSFDLGGLGIDFKKEPLEIGGAFFKETLTDASKQTFTAYEGMAIIRSETFTLSAIGSYAEYNGHPSMFLYATIDQPIGGPAFFFVTGLAAGFGYNRSLTMPSLNQVRNFPLVDQAMKGPQDKATNIQEQISTLSAYIPPAPGEYFFAAGIHYTSFKLLDSFALLVVSFGNSLEIDMLGFSTLVLPAPQVGNTVTPLAEIQLALKASYQPLIGFLKVEAKITPASYLFSRDCHLTGGFAFYSWFAGEHKDEFVLTIGGYHPSYQRPAHFPVVDKLAFNWVLNDNFSIKGDAYFALVPSAVMAGVHLNALFRDGGLSVTFNAGADFIMAWQPYHYDGNVYVNIAVSYTFEFFGKHTITADAGADLHIWGPEFAGTAHVHLWIVTFDVRFGDSSSDQPAPLKWTDFINSFFHNLNEVGSVFVMNGLEKKSGQGTGVYYVINSKDFRLGFNSLIPFKSAKVQGSDDHIKDSDVDLHDANPNIGIAPMAIVSGDLGSQIIIRVKKGTQYLSDELKITSVQKSVPAALWGQSMSPSINGNRMIDNAACGFEITGHPPEEPEHTTLIERSVFQFDIYGQPKSWSWATPLPFNATSQKPESYRRSYLHNQPPDVQEHRRQLLSDLGFSTLPFSDESISATFIVAPLFAENIS